MKKTMMVMIVIACSIAISFSTFASSYMQATESVRLKNERDAVERNTQSDDSTSLQTPDSNIQQTSESCVVRNVDKVDDSSKTENDLALNKRESIAWSTETSHNQISDLPTPLPDGRIFLHSSAETEDPIPYIPTENPKMTTNITIVTLELDI